RYVRVDQRSAAYPGALCDGHVGEAAQVDPAIALGGAVVIPEPGITGSAWIILRLPLPPTLEDQNLAARLRQAAGGDGATEARSDHYHVEFIHRRKLPRFRAPTCRRYPTAHP